MTRRYLSDPYARPLVPLRIWLRLLGIAGSIIVTTCLLAWALAL